MAKRTRGAKKVRAQPLGPTPERIAHGGFGYAFVHHAETGTKARAVTLTPWHVMMHNRGKLSDKQCATIAQYVHQWDITERSPIKSNLDRSVVGNGNGPGVHYLDARTMLNHWNAMIGQIDTGIVVAVACHGLGYSGAATAIYGDNATDHNAKRIRDRFIKVLARLSHYIS